MNKKRRERLREVLNSIQAIVAILQSICDKEEDCVDRYPENLQNSEKYERMEGAVEYLNEAVDKLDEVTELILSAMT